MLYWFSISLTQKEDGSASIHYGGPAFPCIANISEYLQSRSLETAHMITIGGWDAPHPPASTLSPESSYAAFLEWNEQIYQETNFRFQGIDWDLEGNDDVKSPYNFFSRQVLDFVGKFSQFAQADGFIVSMVPPESYLDPTTQLFDQSLLHAYPDHWQPDFKYHGHNAYAYILSRYALTQVGLVSVDTFDVVLIQLYETYSHLTYNTTQLHEEASDYLIRWIPTVLNGWYVEFGHDQNVSYPSQRVAVKQSQLLVGFANGWVDPKKTALVLPESIAVAHEKLNDVGMAPRGYFFWDINDEGLVPVGQTKPLYLSAGLNSFLHVRSDQQTEETK